MTVEVLNAAFMLSDKTKQNHTTKNYLLKALHFEKNVLQLIGFQH